MRRSGRERLRVWALARLDGRCKRAVAERKRALLGGPSWARARSRAGPGVNLGYYPPDIDWVGIESNLSCYPAIRAEAERRGMRVTLREASASGLDEDASMDAVVSMFALCTVVNPARTLGEILRVLRLGGKFVFMEHVGAPAGTALRLVQRASRPCRVRFADGCLPDADTMPLIQAAGFSHVENVAFNSSPRIASRGRFRTRTRKHAKGGWRRDFSGRAEQRSRSCWPRPKEALRRRGAFWAT